MCWLGLFRIIIQIAEPRALQVISNSSSKKETTQYSQSMKNIKLDNLNDVNHVVFDDDDNF